MSESSKPPLGKRMKAQAPPPPQAPQPAPRHIFRNISPDVEETSAMEAKENILKPTVEFLLTLPQGSQVSVIKDGSKPLMDLLVELCSQHHLNPALHTLELLSPEGHSLGFKPNALLGALNVACILIKEKVLEDKVVRRPAPKVPEKTVRLMVNFNGSQKTVVRVNPLVPLQALMPVICDKCEFDPSYVLLLKDSVSHHELSLDKSLAELGIKELYVHDQKLDSISSSTTSLGKPEKKGLFGIFQFGRRKSKTETTSKNMDNCADKIMQNTDTQSNGLSTVSRVSRMGESPYTLGQSHSVMNIPKLSPKAEAKKRQAPRPPPIALTPGIRHPGFEASQMISESQLRKRKAPAPPPTPTAILQGYDDASTSATSTPDNTSETPPPVNFTNVAESPTFTEVTVLTQTVKAAPLKVSVYDVGPTTSSSSTSSSTPDSAAEQDSSSDLSPEDSDSDLDQSGSRCSTLTTSSVSGSVQALTITKSSFTKVDDTGSNVDAQMNPEVVSKSSSRSETESALNVRLNEVENYRHSAIGNPDQQVPPKPRRFPVPKPSNHDQPPTLSIPSSSLYPSKVTESNPPLKLMEREEAPPQSWLHSMNSSAASGPQAAAQEETVSLGSSRGYAASEGMAEDSGIVSSPSETQTTSPDGSLSLHGGSRDQQEKVLAVVRDSFSDSDEGCATWGSIHRHPDINPQAETVRLENGDEDDLDLKAQFHQSLADFETDLQGHIPIMSAKARPYTMSTDSNEVPVSIVDMDVPVTAIDEVLEVFEHSEAEHKAKFLSKTKSTESKGSDTKNVSNIQPHNQNNNAYTTAINSRKSKANQSELNNKLVEKRLTEDKSKKNTLETKLEKKNADAGHNKDYKKFFAVESTPDIHKTSRSTEVISDEVRVKSYQQKTPHIPALSSCLVLKNDEEEQKVYQNNSSFSISPSKITHNVSSRFGMKTFTVVPSKPACVHAATEESDVRITTGAIKIDDQGNMVTAGITRKKKAVPIQSEDASLGKAKAYWSSNQRQEVALLHSQDLNNKTKEDIYSLKKASPAVVEPTLRSCKIDHIKPTQATKLVKGEAEDYLEGREGTEENQKISVSKTFTHPSNTPVLLPSLLPDMQRDLSFLKSSRRTSSQYVASAISKYAPKSNAPSNIYNYSSSMKAETTGYPKSGRSILVNPRQSSQSSFSDNKENVSMFTPKAPGPKRSMSFPDYVTESQKDVAEDRQDGRGLEIPFVTETAKKTQPLPLVAPKIKAVANNKEDNLESLRSRSPSPTKNNALNTPTKPPSVPKPASQGSTKSSDNIKKIVPPFALDGKPLTSGSVSDNGVTLETPSVTLFGPVTKFRPVIQKSLEKDTSLHNSLMEAINTGGGRERLKKVSTSGSRSLKKVENGDVENERCALLAAIRGHNSTSRLRKTKSEAADELENFRRVTLDEKQTVGSFSSPSLTCTSPVFNPPPPPPAPIVGPPPPPPLVLPQAKLSSPVHPSANNPLNVAIAREAMLDAIRSGSAAERLKKVAAPIKTVQVNGRLGTIQATPATISPH